ncbi:MAG TPA: ABC transporter substrate-binding protein [Aliidongia sp.]|uniref:ABC transporter substrate-binding protein n=1 Tax=Aliidongia sp. TaxID=1914230 RepID=UPI002DDD456B|nr:ABC transporter substrate-binding protein [Aliidongia sp.]HEV2675373.1 ABC transporter substrate-binding protein [Aliidongia sp.]
MTYLVPPGATRLSRRTVITQFAGSTLLGLGTGLLPARAFAQTASGKDLATELAAAVPSGTSIAVADQDDAVGVPWQLSGVSKDTPYKATIANFSGGTAVLEALISGAVDIGYVGEAPLPIAVGRGVTDLVAVAANGNPGSPGGYFLVVQPNSGIKTVAELKGRTVAYPPGTGRHMIVASILHANGLAFGSDVKGIELTGSEIAPTFASGSVDAAIILGNQYFRLGKPPIIADGTGHNWGLNLWLVRRDLFDHPAKAAAVADFVRRAVAFFDWQIARPDDWVRGSYVKKQGMTFEQGKWVDEVTGGGIYYPIDGVLTKVYQQIADGLLATGALKQKIDISPYLDGRFNSIVAWQNQRDGIAPRLLEQPKRS